LTLETLWPVLREFGLAGVFAFFYWLERTERRELQIKNDALTKENIETVAEFTSTVRELKAAFHGRRPE
jgi:hypothetical protein